MMTVLAPITYVIKKGLIHTLDMNKENMVLMMTHFISYKTFIKIPIDKCADDCGILYYGRWNIVDFYIQINLLKKLEYFY